MLLGEITCWRAALRRTALTVLQAIETGEPQGRHRPRAARERDQRPRPATQPHDARFLRDPQAADHAMQTWQRLLPATLA